MNLLNLRRATRNKTGIQSTAVVANSAIDEQLNEGYKILCSKIANINEDFFEEQKVKFNLGLNSALYSLPTDCLKFKQLRLAYTAPDSEDDYKIATPYDPTAIDDIQAEEIDVATSNPIVDITNNYFRISPKPTSAVTDGGEIYFIARPSALTLTGDTPVFPVDYHDLLSDYASFQICSWHSKWEKWKVYKGEWEVGIEKMLKDLVVRNLNKPERFRNFLETTKKRGVTELWD